MSSVAVMPIAFTTATAEVIARQMLLYNRVIPIAEIVERIEAVSAEDIQKAAQILFTSKPTYTLLGDITDYPDYERLQKYLQF